MDSTEVSQDMDRWPALPCAEMNLTQIYFYVYTKVKYVYFAIFGYGHLSTLRCL
jgi:hypothetical protein